MMHKEAKVYEDLLARPIIHGPVLVSISQSFAARVVSGLEKSAAIRPFATKKSRLASETFLLADSLASESCRLADRLATKHFFKADNADAYAD